LLLLLTACQIPPQGFIVIDNLQSGWARHQGDLQCCGYSVDSIARNAAAQ
jgi:hypothetical protein